MPFSTLEEEAYDRLHRAGWTLGFYSLAGPHGVVCVVECLNGENLVRGEGETLEGAYLSACDQARALGMLAGTAAQMDRLA
jgi:hypothetical protein